MTENTSHLIRDGDLVVQVRVRPLGAFYGVFVDESEEPVGVGRSERAAIGRAVLTVRARLHDIVKSINGSGRAAALCTRLGRTLSALEDLEGMS